jgi:hypothetical protein
MGEFVLDAVLIGTGATMFMDLAALARKHLFGTPLADYALVGRWIAYMRRGRFIHRPITASSPVQGEAVIGWIAHYGIGMFFAFLLLALTGGDWVRHPTILPALAMGIGSLAAPFFLMQPGMGLGIAARKSLKPGAARLRSLVTHSVFGLGLYGAALAICPWR